MEQPFYIGQKVVALRSAMNNNGTSILVKDDVYTIDGCLKCHVCGEWHAMLAEFRKTSGKSTCCNCPTLLQPAATHALVTSDWLAPLNPPRVSALPELLKAPVEERVDHRQPIKILSS